MASEEKLNTASFIMTLEKSYYMVKKKKKLPDFLRSLGDAPEHLFQNESMLIVA